MPVRVAVDVGGTFTDVCILDEASGEVSVDKVPSTPHNPLEAVIAGVKHAGIDLSDTALFAHGTTVATNALITRHFPPAAMVTTKGFRDVIEVRRGSRDDLWDAYKDVAPPYIRRRDRLVVTERINGEGDVVTPLDEVEAREVAGILRDRGIESVAVCFINAFLNGANERRMKEILEEELPGVFVCTSSEVLPEIFEHERFSTTVANAVLAPLIGKYVQQLEHDLRADGYRSDLVVLHSGGGVMTPKTAANFAARLAGSGIAAGALASRHLAMLAGYKNSIGLDMGGTSTDISLTHEGEIHVTKDWHVQFGYPICFPAIEVLTIGAGGGSLAWIDEGGSLRNGPQSAGADPGPACYMRGGTQATNTDANLILGRLGAELVGGGVALDRDAAERAIQQTVCEPLGLGLIDAAKAIIRVANANMADATRIISIRRGHDPRDFALVVFGGAGPLHGVALARDLSIPVVISPPNPGITSALGCLLVDVRHDFSRMFVGLSTEVDPSEIEAAFSEMEVEANERLRHEGVREDQMQLGRTMDMRYIGQWRSITVPVNKPVSSLEEAVASFHAAHDREYNFRRDETPVEVYRLGLVAIGVVKKAELAQHSLNGTRVVPVAHRPIYFDELDDAVEAPVYQRSTLSAGVEIEGPAVVDQLDSTTLVPPGITAEVDSWLNIVMRVEGKEQR